MRIHRAILTIFALLTALLLTTELVLPVVLADNATPVTDPATVTDDFSSAESNYGAAANYDLSIAGYGTSATVVVGTGVRLNISPWPASNLLVREWSDGRCDGFSSINTYQISGDMVQASHLDEGTRSFMVTGPGLTRESNCVAVTWESQPLTLQANGSAGPVSVPVNSTVTLHPSQYAWGAASSMGGWYGTSCKQGSAYEVDLGVIETDKTVTQSTPTTITFQSTRVGPGWSVASNCVTVSWFIPTPTATSTNTPTATPVPIQLRANGSSGPILSQTGVPLTLTSDLAESGQLSTWSGDTCSGAPLAVQPMDNGAATVNDFRDYPVTSYAVRSINNPSRVSNCLAVTWVSELPTATPTATATWTPTATATANLNAPLVLYADGQTGTITVPVHHTVQFTTPDLGGAGIASAWFGADCVGAAYITVPLETGNFPQKFDGEVIASFRIQSSADPNRVSNCVTVSWSNGSTPTATATATPSEIHLLANGSAGPITVAANASVSLTADFRGYGTVYGWLGMSCLDTAAYVEIPASGGIANVSAPDGIVGSFRMVSLTNPNLISNCVTITWSSTPTATATSSPVLTATSTASLGTPTDTSTPIASSTSTTTPAATDTTVSTGTPTDTSTPIASSTSSTTPVATNTVLSTGTPTDTSTPIASSTSSTTPVATDTTVSTGTPTNTSTPIASSTSTTTPVATETTVSTGTPRNTPTAGAGVSTGTAIPSAAATSTDIPGETGTSTPVRTPTSPPEATPTAGTPQAAVVIVRVETADGSYLPNGLQACIDANCQPIGVLASRQVMALALPSGSGVAFLNVPLGDHEVSVRNAQGTVLASRTVTVGADQTPDVTFVLGNQSIATMTPAPATAAATATNMAVSDLPNTGTGFASDGSNVLAALLFGLAAMSMVAAVTIRQRRHLRM